MGLYDRARRNISRTLARPNRSAQVIYVYQRPELAWSFVLAREKQDGRHIPCHDFIRQFYAAKETVCQLKQEFHQRLQVDVIIKHNDNENGDIGIDLSADEIDAFVSPPYDPDQLARLLTGASR